MSFVAVKLTNCCAIFLVSPVLDCGHTLVGGKKVVRLTCENRGGDGKFCIMRKSCWPTTTFQVYFVMTISISQTFKIMIFMRNVLYWSFKNIAMGITF